MYHPEINLAGRDKISLSWLISIHGMRIVLSADPGPNPLYAQAHPIWLQICGNAASSDVYRVPRVLE
jgi:hypothetical protein